MTEKQKARIKGQNKETNKELQPAEKKKKEGFVESRQNRISEIDAEYVKHTALQEKAVTELKGLNQNLKESKKIQRQEVRGTLAEKFSATSEEGIIDAVQTMPIVSKKMIQLEESIVRMTETLEWSRGQHSRLRQEKSDLLEEIQEHYLTNEIRTVYKLKDVFIKQFQGCEDALEAIKDSIKRCWALNPDYLQTLNKNYTPADIKPDRWTLNFLDAFKGGNINDLSTLILVDQIGRWGSVHGENPFAQSAQRMPQTELIKPSAGEQFPGERLFT